MTRSKVETLVFSALLLTTGLILPFFTGQIPQVGSMLLPMHLPVLLCGLICGWRYGLAVGLIMPVMRSFLFGMPPMFPTAISMAVEMAVYGAVSGWLYSHSRWQCVVSLYRSLIAAMIAGRIAWGGMQILLLGISGSAFTWQMFMAGAFLNAIPGIILQLTFIPALMVALDRAGVVHFKKSHQETKQAG